MTHLFQPRQPIHKEPAFAVMVTAVLVLWILLLLAGCAEKERPPTMGERLQGAWAREWGTLTNRYNFHHGACDVYSTTEGQCAYAYTTDGDTLTMMDLASKTVRRAAVTFPTDSTAVLGWEKGFNYHLKRM